MDEAQKKFNKEINLRDGRKAKYFFKKHWIDLLFAVIVIFLFLMGFLIKYNESCSDWFHYEGRLAQAIEEDGLNIIEFITIIIPALITIVTIGISLPDTEIYGLHYSDFRRIRSDFEYSLLWMILISVFVLLFAILANIFGFYWTAVVLNVISLVYCLIFIIKEVPILTKKEKFLFRLIRNSNYSQARDEHLDSKNKKRTSSYNLDRKVMLNQVKTYLLFYQHIHKTFKILYKCKRRRKIYSEEDYKKRLLDELISLQNNYLDGLYQNYYLIKDIGDNEFHNISITDAVAGCVKNVEELLDNNPENFLLDIFNYSDDLVPLTEMINTLSKVLPKLNLDKCYASDMEKIISKLMPEELQNADEYYDDQTKKNEHKISISAAIALKCLDSKQLWYFDYFKSIYRDYRQNKIFEKIDPAFVFFLSICLYYASPKNVDTPFTNEIKKWEDEYTKEATKSDLNLYKNNSNFDKKLTLLDRLFNIYFSSGKTYMYIAYTLGDMRQNNVSISQDYNYIYFWWLNLLNKKEIDSKNFRKIDKLIEKYKQKYPEAFLLNLSDVSQEDYFKLFDDYFSHFEIEKDYSFDDFVSLYKTRKTKDVKTSTGESTKTTIKETIEKQIEILNSYFKKPDKHRLTEYSLFEGTYNIKEISYLLKIDNQINFFGDIFSTWILTPSYKISHLTFGDDSIKAFISSNEDYYCVLPKGVSLSIKETEIWEREFKNRVADLRWPLRNGLLFVKNAIEFYAEISKLDCNELTNKEVEDYINNNCRLYNGLYSLNMGGYYEEFYSKSVLEDVVKANIFHVNISIKYQFRLVDAKKIMFIEPNEVKEK